MQGYFKAAPIGRRYFLWIALGFLLGILQALNRPLQASRLCYLPLLSLLFLGILFLLRWVLSRFRIRISLSIQDSILLWLILTSFLLGMFRVYTFDNLDHATLKESAGVSRTYQCIVTGEPTLSNSGKSRGFTVKVLSYRAEDQTEIPCTGNILLYAPLDVTKDLHPGDSVSFTEALYPSPGGMFEGDFNIQHYLYRQNLQFLKYTDKMEKTHLPYTPTAKDRFFHLSNTLRTSMLSSIRQSFGTDSEESALLQGILLGVREDFSQEQYQNFLDSGLIHITAVSGMHVMFLSSFLLAILRRLRAPKFLRVLLIIPALLLFAAVSSFTPSVCRATAMMILFILAECLRQESDSLTSLAVSALFLLILNPYTVTSYSFILSFSSVLGIIFFYGPFYRYLGKPFQKKNQDRATARKGKPFWRRRLVDPVLSSLALTGGGTMGSGFFLVYFFQRISWGSFPANLCLLPVTSITFVLGLIHWPISILFPPLGNLIAKIPLQGMLWYTNQVAEFFSHPVFRIQTPKPHFSAILPYLVFCIALAFTMKSDSENNA